MTLDTFSSHKPRLKAQPGVAIELHHNDPISGRINLHYMRCSKANEMVKLVFMVIDGVINY